MKSTHETESVIVLVALSTKGRRLNLTSVSQARARLARAILTAWLWRGLTDIIPIEGNDKESERSYGLCGTDADSEHSR